jgi:HEAT repeat protein
MTHLMRDNLPTTTVRKSPLARLGLGDEPGPSAKYFRALLAFLKEAPGIGWALKGGSEALLELAGEEDDARFSERLLGLVTQSREGIEALASLGIVLLQQQQTILERLDRVGQPAEPQLLTAFALAAALFAYQQRVARDYQYADYRGIEGTSRAEHAVSLPFEEVFVTPRLIAERSASTARDSEREVLRALVEARDLPSDQRARLEADYAALSGKRWHPGEKEEAPGAPFPDALKDARHAVIIGGPGIGKSTLVKHLARTCARGPDATKADLNWADAPTPVVVQLAGFADALSARPTLTLRTFLDARLGEQGGEPLRIAIGDELSAGRALVLLDGVDEVPDISGRVVVVRAVDAFIAEHAVNRCIVTSRPYGYIRLAGDIEHFQMPNFSPEQVEIFVRQWQQAFERWRHPDAPELQGAEREAEAMVQEIRRNPKVAELATNPLMLVIVSLIRHEGRRLPDQRVQLYQRAVNTLLDTWNQWRSLPQSDKGGARLAPDRLVRVLGAIAEWTRRTKPTGVIHRTERKRELVRILEDRELDEGDAEATAESYLSAAAGRSGLLEERGQDIFAFWHPTFEEFLAAVELTTPTSRAIERVVHLRDDPRWREVILLAAGYIGVVQRDPDTATTLVEALSVRNPTPLEGVLHSALRLAAQCIADDVGVKRTLVQRVVLRLAEVAQTQPYNVLRQAFTTAVAAVPQLRVTADAVSQLRPATANRAWSVRMEATRLLANVAATIPEARVLCEDLLRDSDPDVRCHAALGLARAGDYRQEVWLALSHYQSEYAGIEVLVRQFTSLASAATDSMVALLASDDAKQRFAIARLLVGAGRAPLQVANTLIASLSAEEPMPRLQAAEFLVQIGRTDERVVDALIASLSAEEPGLRVQAAQLLAQMGRTDKQMWSG